MKITLLAVLLLLPAVHGLECWLCRVNAKTGDGPESFSECDEKKEKQACPDIPKPSCGTFLFTNKQGREIHAKSCVYEHYCGANETFCQNMKVNGSGCRLQCCDTQLCNYYKEGFAPTGPTLLPYDEDEDELDDCSWIDAGSSLGLPRVVLWACALHASLVWLTFADFIR